MEEFVLEDLIDREYNTEEIQMSNNEVISIINTLQLNSNNVEMLTRAYTDILNDDNVVYILTRISQNQIFMRHFPEFYEKNENGESVINCQQNSRYHKYGVFKHILYTIESVGKDNLKYSTHDMKLLKWTMLLHDIGKPMAKTINSEGYDSFSGHDDISVEIADKILDRFDFTEEDKKIILTLIKYHDRYLNEGDLTYDNLSFLAKELDDKKELFQLLIEVKLADNKAKSVDTYNKFMTVVGKYYDFLNEYFANEETNMLFDLSFTDESVVTKIDEDRESSQEMGTYNEGGSKIELTEDMINTITKEITAGRALQCYYEPIIDLQKNQVDGYEVYYKIVTKEDFSYKQIIRKAKEFGKYDKLQQMLFVNSLERFNEIKGKQDVIQYINIDAKSYQNYVNKARIFELLDKNKVVIEFNGYETVINSKIKELSHEIHLRRGNTALDNYESSNKTLKDVEQIGTKYIKYKIESMESNQKERLEELATYCMLNNIKLIAFGVNSKELLDFAIECKIRFVQGAFFGLPTEGLDMSETKINNLLKNNDEMII